MAAVGVVRMALGSERPSTWEMPTLIVTGTSMSGIGAETAVTNLAMRLLMSAGPRSSTSTTNSSPPIRATTSVGRTSASRRCAIVCSARSPTACPYRSLTGLNPFRSQYSSVAVRWGNSRAR